MMVITNRVMMAASFSVCLMYFKATIIATVARLTAVVTGSH